VSLLDRGPHLLDIYPETTTTDDLGNVVVGPAPTPVRVRMAVQPITSDEVDVVGQQTTTTYRAIARTAPLGAWALVRWIDQDMWCDVVGEPRLYGMSPRTAHVDAVLRRRRTPITVAVHTLPSGDDPAAHTTTLVCVCTPTVVRDGSVWRAVHHPTS
jgi:hypothetical protein